MKTIETDVLIIGNGLAGSTLANALIHHPFLAKRDYIGVHILDMGKPINDFTDQPFDIRISSINRGSEKIIKSLGAWKNLNQDRAFPYRYVAVASAESSNDSSLVFDSHENNLSHMGTMVENQHLVRALHLNLQDNNNLCSMHFGCKVESIHYDEGKKKWHVTTNQTTFICHLLVGADGRNSVVRDAANIDVTKGFYQQKCIVGNITVDGELKSTAWQRFLDTGPIGILPMSQEGDSTANFSLAWSCDEPLVDKITTAYGKDKELFKEQLQPLLPDYFGNITDVNNIASYPLWHQQAKYYYLPGLVLIGDAAHTIHPLAGLGANLGIRDAAVLAEELFQIDLLNNHDQINFSCQNYQRKCKQYNNLALNTMSIFKSLFAKDSQLPSTWLSKALSLGNNLNLIKSNLLESATGLDKNAPDLSPYLPVEN